MEEGFNLVKLVKHSAKSNSEQFLMQIRWPLAASHNVPQWLRRHRFGHDLCEALHILLGGIE
jgi:hypothetical protein